MIPKKTPISLLYQPIPKKEMNVVVMGSGKGVNLEFLLEAQKKSPSPPFRIKALFVNKKCRFQEIGEREGIPVIYHSFVNFSRREEISRMTAQDARLQYDQEIVELLQECSKKYRFTVDMILLAGYMQLLSKALLNTFPNKVLNIHPADLSVLNLQGNRAYTGLNAVYEALLAGESFTRSNIILVNEEIDGGPVLVSGPKVSYVEPRPVTAELANIHQEKQKLLSDGPACLRAITLISQGRIGIDQKNIIYIDGTKQSDKGYDMEVIN